MTPLHLRGWSENNSTPRLQDCSQPWAEPGCFAPLTPLSFVSSYSVAKFLQCKSWEEQEQEPRDSFTHLTESPAPGRGSSSPSLQPSLHEGFNCPQVLWLPTALTVAPLSQWPQNQGRVVTEIPEFAECIQKKQGESKVFKEWSVPLLKTCMLTSPTTGSRVQPDLVTAQSPVHSQQGVLERIMAIL